MSSESKTDSCQFQQEGMPDEHFSKPDPAWFNFDEHNNEDIFGGMQHNFGPQSSVACEDNKSDADIDSDEEEKPILLNSIVSIELVLITYYILKMMDCY